MTNYGLNKQQIKNAKNKLVKNKEFMINNGIHRNASIELSNVLKKIFIIVAIKTFKKTIDVI
ncbi:MAG: hypothetical protein PHQ93_02990 [Sulfurimonas sp.]|uniref:hypothetical protein n=1 Tax=Sulfurimonas sp. TaxID=2022749 RepID=UPI00260B1752|nr:hypothetical protein [Sulfurimonas sp.]MDD5400137.1 hypothetical protein [Sulfurimonas sp.]